MAFDFHLLCGTNFFVLHIMTNFASFCDTNTRRILNHMTAVTTMFFIVGQKDWFCLDACFVLLFCMIIGSLFDVDLFQYVVLYTCITYCPYQHKS